MVDFFRPATYVAWKESFIYRVTESWKSFDTHTGIIAEAADTRLAEYIYTYSVVCVSMCRCILRAHAHTPTPSLSTPTCTHTHPLSLYTHMHTHPPPLSLPSSVSASSSFHPPIQTGQIPVPWISVVAGLVSSGRWVASVPSSPSESEALPSVY